MNNRNLGKIGEECAQKHLKKNGYRILEVNFRNKLGEIDLIAMDRRTVCFIEVKTRRSLHYGAPYEAVHSTKQRKMVQMSLSYLKYKFASIDILSRFDVISINFSLDKGFVIEHIKNAFDLTYLSD